MFTRVPCSPGYHQTHSIIKSSLVLLIPPPPPSSQALGEHVWSSTPSWFAFCTPQGETHGSRAFPGAFPGSSPATAGTVFLMWLDSQQTSDKVPLRECYISQARDCCGQDLSWWTDRMEEGSPGQQAGGCCSHP